MQPSILNDYNNTVFNRSAFMPKSATEMRDAFDAIMWNMIMDARHWNEISLILQISFELAELAGYEQQEQPEPRLQ